MDNDAGEEEQGDKRGQGEEEQKAGEEEQKSEDDETKQEENQDPDAEPPAPIDVEGESARVKVLLLAKKRDFQRGIEEHLQNRRQCVFCLRLLGCGWKRD